MPPVFFPCQCWYCAKGETHPSAHVESTKVNGVVACNKCAHITPLPKLKPHMPEPDCEMGYSEDLLRMVMTGAQWEHFAKWAIGLPVSSEKGRTVFSAGDVAEWFFGYPVEGIAG